MTEDALIRYLRELDSHRAVLEAIDRVLQKLPPADRLVADRMLLHPEKNASLLLTELLGVEVAAIYRRRKRILRKLLTALPNIKWTIDS